MAETPLNWKVKPILEEHKTTPYAFMKGSSLSSDVAYGICNNTHPNLHLSVIEKALLFLRQLTNNKKLQIGDIVEFSK